MIAGWTTAPFFSNFPPSTWSSRPTVATVYCIPILATLHPLLLSSHVIQSLPAIYTKHFDSHPIILGIVSILANLVQSRQHCWYVSSLEEGRRFAKSIKVFHLIKTAIPIYGYDEILRRNIINIVKGMCRSDFHIPKSHSESCRDSILCDGGATVIISLLNCCLHTQHAVEVVRAVCCVVSQLCRVSCGPIPSPSQTGFTAPVLAALEAARVLEEVLAGLRSQAENEAAVLEYLTLLAVLASDRRSDGCDVRVGNGATLVLQHDFVRQVVRCGNACQVADEAMLVSGILWKLAVAGGWAVVLVAGAVVTLLKLMQQFAQSVVVARNAVGCLAILCQNGPGFWRA